MSSSSRVNVGVGVVIYNDKNEVLVGKRIGTHAPYWSIFGGHVEAGETFEQCAIREIKEEVGIDIENPYVFGISNNIETFRLEGKHTVSVCIAARYEDSDGKKIAPKSMEPHKCEQLRWVKPTELPQPHFEASTNSVDLWLKRRFYHHPAPSVSSQSE